MVRVLEECKFSQRKQITGLDNYTGDGLEGFRILNGLVDKLEVNVDEKKRLRSSVMSALAYLKGSYRSHVTKRVSTCPTHCCMFALSNPLDRELMTVCDHDHDDIRNDCENVFKCLDQVNEMICKSVQDGVKEEHLCDVEVAVMYITEWMRHILRAAHTQDTKKTILENMDESSAMLIGDWMMKILHQYFREKMENWFGKRGISGHVHSFIMRQGNNYKRPPTLRLLINAVRMDTHQLVFLSMILRLL